MAHIVRRGESFCVVYYYTDKDGKRHQKWETFHQEAEAERRKAEVEIGKKKSTLIVPSKITVSELMVDFVNLYGERKWDVSTYSSNLALIANYINPLIGNAGVSAVPAAARVSQDMGIRYDRSNYLLMHAMGPNVAGVVGSAVAAGILLSFLG